MDKRFFLALVLTAAVVIGIPLLMPTPPVAPVAADTTTAVGGAPAPASAAGAPPPATAADAGTGAAAGAAIGAAADSASVVPMAAAETTTVVTPLSTYRFSSIGAAPVSVEMTNFRSLLAGDGEQQRVDLARDGAPLLRYRLFVDGDTISLHGVPFSLTRGAEAAPGGIAPLVYEGSARGMQLRIAYSFLPDSYMVRVRADVQGTSGAYLFLDYAEGLRSAEADVTDDQRNLAYAYKGVNTDANSIGFGKLDPGESRLVPGPLAWVAQKNKYFLFALLAPEQGAPFGELRVTGGPRTGREASNALGTVVAPLGTANAVEFTIYAGPQEWRRMIAVGRDFQNVSPYGGFMQGVVQPFATIVMRMLLWMRDTTQLNYGWVLVIFGVTIRLLMWPLNQKAMRSTIKMQRLQPEMQAIQKLHANDPEKQRTEMMRIYKDHGMSPLSPIMGCLPMMLPMPILFALFWVFQGTIEFRGVPFLWLNDISIHDPLFIMPALMGLTTFLVSWIGMRGVPPNPQTKLFAYVLPLAFAVMFAKLASGLHIYYTVQNLAAIPQQWLIANERKKAAPATPVVQGPPAKPKTPPAPARKRA